ncbi:MAG: TraB/GumN family protein [Treponema sp.]|jgi:uncharacterized protein YbaP (TraB family)|nr:TraB/GumN family protein [Treponema sp.]
MRRIISFCVIVFVAVGLFSCASSPRRGQSGSSVWKISRGGNTLFLGGSVHILRETDYPLPAAFDRAYSQSSMLVIETDVERLAEASVAQYLMANMFLPGNQTLRTILDSRAYEMLDAAFREYGQRLDGFIRFKPSMVVNVLSLLQMQKMGFIEEGVDFYYLEKARNEKKSVAYLESIETQIDLIVTMGEGYENDFVLYSLYDMESTEAGILSIVEEWKRGSSSATEESLLEMRDEWPVLYKTTITDRNSAWMPTIMQYLASGKVAFVIVGLAHIHGPDGLLRQLENAGCTVGYF